MKKMLCLLMFLAVAGLSACGSPEADRNTPRDGGEGLNDYKPPIDEELDEDPDKEEEDCRKYKGGGFSFLPDEIAVSKWLQNCLAKMIDNNLKPLCEEEREVRDRLAYYESRGDQEAVEIAEDELQAIEDQKYEVADGIYSFADESSNIDDELRDRIDDTWGEDDSFMRRIGASVGHVFIGSEVGSITRVLDSRARRVCRSQIDLSRIPSRKSD